MTNKNFLTQLQNEIQNQVVLRPIQFHVNHFVGIQFESHLVVKAN